jgi:NAD kinase
MDIYIDGLFLTGCIGDGIIFATPYGSLAYLLSTNGPILSNKTNSITMVPVCPLSKSFRPICLPNTTIIRVKLS